MRVQKPFDVITDFATGLELPCVGAEENRQAVEKYLDHEKGYAKEDIEVDVEIEIELNGQMYRSHVDLVIGAAGKRFMAIKCAAGSLASREREIVAAARLVHRYQLPLAVVSDGDTAIVLDTLSGKKVAEGMPAIPSREEALNSWAAGAFVPLPESRHFREKLIFRTYDMENVNVRRNIPPGTAAEKKQ